MGRIKGYYVWDDDNLSPGQKKEGGLHQNLFDHVGKLKASARFVPDDGDDEPLVVTETVYVPAEERLDDDDFALKIALAVRLIEIGVEGLPHALRWWKDTGRPVVADVKQAAQRVRLPRLKKRKKAKTLSEDAVLPAEDTVEAPAADRPKMSNAEAHARYLAALAARAYSEQQLGLVMSSDIVDMDVHELEESVKQLLEDEEVRGLLEQMIRNPGMLADHTLANIASVIGPRSQLAPAQLTSDLREEPTDPAPRSPD